MKLKMKVTDVASAPSNMGRWTSYNYFVTAQLTESVSLQNGYSSLENAKLTFYYHTDEEGNKPLVGEILEIPVNSLPVS